VLKKTVTYENPFTNEQVTEDLYFNLTKAELADMSMRTPDGDLKAHLERIAQAQNGQEIMDAMKWIIFTAYGKRKDNSFIKNDQIREEFESSEAYSALFMEMVMDADNAIEFVRGIIPKDMLEDANQEQLPVDAPNLAEAPTPEKPRRVNAVEARVIPHDQLRAGLADGSIILV